LAALTRDWQHVLDDAIQLLFLAETGHLEDAPTRRLGSLRYVRLFQNPVAAEVTRLKPQAFQGI
jgi:hypothetical protein